MTDVEAAFEHALDALERCDAAHDADDRFTRALACVDDHIAGAFGEDLRSLAVCGSFARGEADELSDLDLWAIVAQPWSRFCFLRVHGVAVDLDVMSEAAVPRETARTPYYRNVARDARIVRDVDGAFAALRDRLTAAAPRDERIEAWCRLRPHAVIRDAAHALQQGVPAASLLLDAALFEILALPGILAGVTARRPARTLDRIGREIPAAASLIDAFLAAPLVERPAILERLAAVALADVGGPVERFRTAPRPALPGAKLQRARSVL